MKREDSEWWREGFTREWWLGVEEDGVDPQFWKHPPLPEEDRLSFLNLLDDEQLVSFHCDWRVWARDSQLAPEGLWTTWLLLAGRGFGKTRVITETCDESARTGAAGRIALVGQGEDDIREVLIEGDSGFMKIAKPGMQPKFQPSVGAGRLIWPNGATAYLYSAADPESLRGPQFDLAVFDEPMAVPAEFRQKTISNLRFGLRLGVRPRLMYATTPKPHRWLTEELAKAAKYQHLPLEQRRYILTRGSTWENRANLPEAFFEGLIEDYEGTNLGRQEIYAEILGDEEGALWTAGMLDKCRLETPSDPADRMAYIRQFARSSKRVVIGVDPNNSASSKTAHEAGIVCAAIRGERRIIIDDWSIGGGPQKWGSRAVACFVEFEADEIVVEVNNGGEMCKMVLEGAARDMGVDIKVHMVRASRGKQRRAEPVAAAYDRGQVNHLGSVGTTLKPGPFFKLESQMCALHEALDPTGEDFDRCDAAVWALTRLGGKRARRSGASHMPSIMTFGGLIGASHG